MKTLHKAIIAALLLLTVQVVYAATFTDNFNRTDGGLGANWTTQIGTAMVVSSNHAKEGLAAEDEFAFNNSITYANDQECSATYTKGDSSYFGVTGRASGTGGSAANYSYVTDGDTYSAIHEFGGGSNPSLVTGLAVPASGSVIKIKVTGSSPATIEVFDDGASLGSTTDSTLSSGSCGIYGFGSGGGASYLDDFLGADVGGGGGGGGATPCLRLLLGVGCEVTR